MEVQIERWTLRRARATPAAVASSGLLALAVAMGIGRFAFTPILPMMQEDAGLSVVQGGWLASANYLGYLVGALWAARRVRPQAAIRWALVAIALSTLGMGFTYDFVGWLALRAVAGIASAWALVHVSSWCLEQLAALRKPLLDGAVFAGVGAGIAVAGSLCLAAMSTGGTAAQAWLALGVLSLIVTAVVWPVLGAGAQSRAASSSEKYAWPWQAWLLIGCYGAFGFGYIILATVLPLMAKQAISDPQVFGWAWPIFGVTAAASTLLVAPLARIFASRRVWMLSALAMALGVSAPVFFPGLSGIVAAAVLVGGSFMVITMAGMQEARRVAGGNAPALMFASALLVLSATALLKEKR